MPHRRELNDPQTLRALTHPIRLALLDALELEGPLTATQAGELIGEPPNACSFHFRQLAKYGFVEEAGPAPGRARPWRRKVVQMHFSDVHEDAATAIAARALDQLLRERYYARLEAFYASRESLPAEVQETTGASQWVIHVTPDELRALDQEVTAILDRFSERSEDPSRRPSGALPIEVLLFAYPLRPPET